MYCAYIYIYNHTYRSLQEYRNIKHSRIGKNGSKSVLFWRWLLLYYTHKVNQVYDTKLRQHHIGTFPFVMDGQLGCISCIAAGDWTDPRWI